MEDIDPVFYIRAGIAIALFILLAIFG